MLLSDAKPSDDTVPTTPHRRS